MKCFLFGKYVAVPTDLSPSLVVACEPPEAATCLQDFTSTLPRKLKFDKQRYHLRRSNFLQTFNASPDETAYYRMLGTWLVRRNGKE